MTEQEKGILKALADVWNLFMDLPEEHPDDRNDFRYHIHRLQDMVAARPALRSYNRILPVEAARCTLCMRSSQSVRVRDGNSYSLCIYCYNLLTK